MARPRTRDRIEQSVKIPVTWFTPLDDGRGMNFKPDVWASRLFAVDFRWTVAHAGETSARVNSWYDVYTPEYSKRRRVPRDWHTDEHARDGIDRRRRTADIDLEGKPSALGTIVWHFVCPKCGKHRKALFIAPRNHELLCRKCHELRYRSQDPPPDPWQILIAQADETIKQLERRNELKEIELGLRAEPRHQWGRHPPRD